MIVATFGCLDNGHGPFFTAAAAANELGRNVMKSARRSGCTIILIAFAAALSPAEAWEPSPDGVAGEFRSVTTYRDLGGTPGGVNVLGLFGDSLLPLHGYRFHSDLRSA